MFQLVCMTSACDYYISLFKAKLNGNFVNKNAVSKICTFLHYEQRDADNNDGNWENITQFSTYKMQLRVMGR